MALIIRDGTVVTMDARQEILPEADIVINDDLIVGIFYSKANVPPEYQAGEVLDARGLIVLPGFCDAHSHVAMTMLRGMADDLPLKEWLEKRIWPIEERLSREDVYWGALLGMTEMIRSGITSMADMYFYAEEVARAAKEIGIRALIGRGIFSKIWDKSLAESLALYNGWQGQGEGRISVALAPHAPYSCAPNYLEKIAALAADLQLPVHIHLAETRYEGEECQREYGLTPVALLEKVGILAYPVLAAHCVHLSPHDIDILARRRVLVAHNPISNAKLGDGIAPLKALVKAGVRVSLGTDGAASSNRLDMFETMRVANFLPKAVGEDPTFPRAFDVLSMATAGAATVFPGTGCIRAGGKADLILIDPSFAHLTPSWDTYSSLVYSAQVTDVRTVIVNGKIIMKDWELLTVDEAAIKREVRARAEHLARSGQN